MLNLPLRPPTLARRASGLLPFAALLLATACNQAGDAQCISDCSPDLGMPTTDMRRPELPDLSQPAADLSMTPPNPAADIDFEGIPSYPTDSHYGGIGFGVGDFNGDGVPDVAMPLQVDYQIAILFGDGKGGFLPAVKLPAPGVFELSVGDLNKDGKPDILYSQNGLAHVQIAVLLGKGDGTFAPVLLSGPSGNWNWPILVDVNGDGKIDMVSKDGSSVYVVNGKGDGTFEATYTTLSGLSPLLWNIADLDGDGKLDVVVAADVVSGQQVEVRLGAGDGTFGTPQRYDALSANSLSGLAVGDCDGDGKSDLIFTDDHGVFVRKGGPGGALSTGSRFDTVAKVGNPLLADWNGDGKLDIVVDGGASSVFEILYGKGGCDFAAPIVYVGGYGAGAGKAVDVDGDKKLDLLISTGEIGVAIGNGDGTFRAPRVQYTGASPNGLALGDLDGDGKLDLVTSQPDDKSLAVSLGHGDGTFAAPMRIGLPNKPAQVQVADISGDGAPDVIVALTDMHTFALMLGDGKGGLGAPQIFATGIQCAVGDLDGDGKLDVAVSYGEQLQAYLNDGHGKLTAGPALDAGLNIWGLSLGDLDGDGRLDAALVAWEGATLSIAKSLGDHFAAVTPYPTLGQSVAVKVKDCDKDGKRDVVVFQDDGRAISYFAGKGDGTLQNAQSVALQGDTPGNDGILLEDFNGDGLQDLMAFQTNSALQASRGLGPAVPGMPPSFAPSKTYWFAFPEVLASGDVTGDGRPDVLVSVSYATSPGYVAIFRNISH